MAGTMRTGETSPLVPSIILFIFNIPSIHPLVHATIHPFIHLSMQQSIHLSIHFYIYPSTYSSIYPSIHFQLSDTDNGKKPKKATNESSGWDVEDEEEDDDDDDDADWGSLEAGGGANNNQSAKDIHSVPVMGG